MALLITEFIRHLAVVFEHFLLQRFLTEPQVGPSSECSFGHPGHGLACIGAWELGREAVLPAAEVSATRFAGTNPQGQSIPRLSATHGRFGVQDGQSRT